MKTTWIAAVCVVAASACAVEDVVEDRSEQSAAVVDVRIDEVGYGGTEDRGIDGIILPEYFLIENHGATAANLGGYYLTDGPNWGGDGLARLPAGAMVPAGGFIVVANYPPVTHFESAAGYHQVSFEAAYGYPPDYEIKGWQPDVRDAETIKGRVRLTQDEAVMLIEVGLASDDDVVYMLEGGTLPDDLVASTFPRVEID